MRPKKQHSQRLSELARLLSVEQGFAPDLLFTGVSANSSRVVAGDLFVALPGAKVHGATFATAAHQAGAVAILTDTEGSKLVAASNAAPLPLLLIDHPERYVGEIASWFHNRPSQRMRSIGITGTNGKTTTASLISQLLQFQNRSVGVIGTLGAQIRGVTEETGFTTPEACELQSFFATMVEEGVTDLVMEVSSHALSLSRIVGTRFAIVGFSNLTQDHLDFHGDMESYFAAKKKLFTQEYAEIGFVNIDTEFGHRLASEAEIPVLTMSKNDTRADWHYTKYESTSSGYQISIRGTGGILIEGELALLGEHNLENALMAVAISIANGIDPVAVGSDLINLRAAPGRLERVAPNSNLVAIVDYAHTPDAVEHALSTLKARTQGKLIAILGCGGDRDATKRPIMGEYLIQGSDIAIMTSDNPRSESPGEILRQMVGEYEPSERLYVEEDRRKAIALAVTLAEPGDCIALLGKGHETGQLIAGIKYPFDDREELVRALEVLA